MADQSGIINETNIEARFRGYKDGEAGKSPDPQHDYHDERSAAYIDGHSLGAIVYRNDHKELDIWWPLDDEVTIKVTRQAGNVFIIRDINSDRQLRLSWNHNPVTGWARLLFDGQDIETEEYMAYVGLMDTVTEMLGPNGVGTVIMTDESVAMLEDGES